MGKDATNTLFAENQVDQRLGESNVPFKGEQQSEFREEQLNSHVKSEHFAEPFKAEELEFDKSKEVKPSPYVEQFGENAENRHTHMKNTEHHDPQLENISQGLNQGSGLEVREPVGGFHGEKWQGVHEGEQLNSVPLGQSNSAPLSTNLMEDPNAGGFHGDKWKDLSTDKNLNPESWLEGENQPLLNQASHHMGDETQMKSQSRIGQEWASAEQLKEQPKMGDFWQGDQLKGEIILKPHMEDKWASGLPPTHTVFKSEQGLEGGLLREDHFHTGDLNKDCNKAGFQDSVKADCITNGTREANKEMLAELKSHSGPADHVIHPSELVHPSGLVQGAPSEDMTMRDATIYDGRSRPLAPEAHSTLAERVVAGVHAGDPLSTVPLKSAAGKSKKSKKDHKLSKSKTSGEHGKDEHFKSDKNLIPHEHLKKDSSLAEAHLSGGAILQKEAHISPIIQNEKHFVNDAHLNKNVNIVEKTQFEPYLKDSSKEDTTFAKDSSEFVTFHQHGSDVKAESHLPRAGHFEADLNKAQDAYLATDGHTDLHEQGSGKKGGKLKDKMRSKKEKIKEKLGLKKDEELVVGAGHSEHSKEAPKGHEIATIKIPGIESGDRAAQEMVNHQAKAKKELNAELKEHVGHSDHIAPSEILGHGMSHLSLHENRAIDSQSSMPDHGHTTDQITKDTIVAKSELNSAIRTHAGESGFTNHLVPSEISEISSHQKDFQQDSNAFDQSIDVTRDHILAKQGLNAEIKGLGKDHVLPSAVAHQGSEFGHELHGETLAGLSGTDDALIKSNILAKKDLNAEIEGMDKDYILPSAIAHNESGHELRGEQLAGLSGAHDASTKDHILAKKDLNGAAEIKSMAHLDHIVPSEIAFTQGSDQFQHGHELQGEKLAGLTVANDATMKDNILAKKEVNAEIKQHAGGDQILPSELHANAHLHNDNPCHKKDQFYSSDFENDESLTKKDEGFFDAKKGEMLHNQMLAKKEVLAEIKDAPMRHTDQILPSEISNANTAAAVTIHDGRSNGDKGSDHLKDEDHHQTMTEMIKEKVANAAQAVKETLQNFH